MVSWKEIFACLTSPAGPPTLRPTPLPACKAPPPPIRKEEDLDWVKIWEHQKAQHEAFLIARTVAEEHQREFQEDVNDKIQAFHCRLTHAEEVLASLTPSRAVEENEEAYTWVAFDGP